MELSGKTAIVTGGGSGIGAALAVELASNGVSVVVGDLDEAGAHATAASVREAGGTAAALRADASDPSDIEALITLAADEFAPVDIYVANAGIIGKPGLAEESDWDVILDVNLRAHVRAARLLMPQWQSRGSGYFVSVASAAGLLTQLGAAGYAVTKHAAVGFAEWLAITYGDAGVGVSCVCPLGVETPLLQAVRSTDDPDARLGASSIEHSAGVISAADVAAVTVDAVREGRFMVLPHPELLEMYRHKGGDYDRWISGMRRYQRTLRSL
ncbi:NAD(P)-dependent dehydrogenase (short-subunit alcohol dehydrogenase family) [Mycolicibacterium iranicum]|uniref:NAD(P)-dependent dehydrogenase (Short-subunit alcohol dehydrogenase family) n=1 Tax=Mycolicibacterium iranicum TaxID=912594 RepID=A0A839Q4Q6_MYCIR|nr:SDR family NAD(P)-dependent oxidoreductase [Mycolicibacterium iranicum]MBB2991238.1 NAD(P)-dependent dehydrogenase (short-subunit alcohol dehydrogenase family) [Mycolicibacterium iranicum]